MFLAVILVHIASAQEYPGIKKTAQFNLNLLSQTSLGGLAGGSAVSNDYLYVNICTVGLKTLYVSDPANPSQTDFIPGWNELITAPDIDRGYLFAPGDGHLTAYDLSDPSHPLPTSANYGAGNWGTSLFSSDDYIIKTFMNPIGPFESILIELYDAEYIANPQLVWEYYGTNDASFSIFDYENKILYTGGTLLMVDFNNFFSPIVVEYENCGRPLSLEVDNLWCQINIPLMEDYLVCYNRSNPYNLTAIDTVNMPLMVKSLYIYEDFAVVLDGNLHLFDISDRFNWVQVDSVALVNSLFFQLGDGNLIYTTTNDSLFIFSIESGGGINESEFELSPIKNALIDFYPNPFNQSTAIRFDLPKEGVVRLIVYNIQGSEAAKLIDEYKPAGFHEIIFDGSDLSSGIYFARLVTDDYQQTKKMVLMK